jgi:hypothetical protein
VGFLCLAVCRCFDDNFPTRTASQARWAEALAAQIGHNNDEPSQRRASSPVSCRVTVNEEGEEKETGFLVSKWRPEVDYYPSVHPTREGSRPACLSYVCDEHDHEMDLTEMALRRLWSYLMSFSAGRKTQGNAEGS